MKDPIKAYNRLIEIQKEISLLESCSSLLRWDQETYMPAGGTGHRAGQLTLLARLAHERFTHPEVGELLSLCEKNEFTAEHGSIEEVNVREIRRKYDKTVKLPQRLVEELAETTALAHAAWVEARQSSSFETFRPWLERIIALKREQAQALGYRQSPYDPLIDEFEPGETESRLIPLFDELRRGLVPLIEKIVDSPRQPDTSFLEREFPVERQREFGGAAAACMGFNFRNGRLDEVVHPFCTGIGPGDTRITTSYDSSDFRRSFFGILHETGHGLYDQGLDPEHYGTPAGESISLGIHESQSRMWENFVGRSWQFWEYFFPKAVEMFPQALGSVTVEKFVRAVNQVRSSYIRTESDEVTYNLHIILRLELERLLISGELTPGDMPSAWNERFRELLGLEVPDDSLGCLQDVHWSGGYFGYFPTYSLGNMYAAQFFAQAKRDIPELESSISRGDFGDLLEWLRENIHRHGKRFSAGELVEKVTGGPLSTKPLLDYLHRKFSALYNL